MRRPAFLVLATLAAACGGGSGTSNAITYPGVSGHKWLNLAGTVHDPSAAGAAVSCESCHPGNTFAEFDCIGCHTHDQATTDGIHGTMAGYAWTSAACYGCHPDGSASMPDHVRFFPIGTGTTHALACSQCHTDFANRGDTATLACASCHQAISGFPTKHAAVKDYDATSPGCVRCHGDAQVDRVTSHAPFTIASGSATHDTACLHCHDAFRTGDKAFAADFTAENCLGCHTNPGTDSAHAGVSGYVYATASCLGCHPGGTAAPSNHTPAFFPIGTGSAHDGVTCTQCHTDLGHPTDPANFACASCHAGLAGFSTKHTVSGYGILVRVTACSSGRPVVTPVTPSSVDCLRCHADSQVDRVASHPSGESSFGNGSHRAAGCYTCHRTMRTDKTFGIDFTASGSPDSSTSSCAVCHANGCAGGG